MPLVTEKDVREIFDTGVVDLSAFITAADIIVLRELASATAADQKEVARWLTAHLVTACDPSGRKDSLKVDDLTVRYSGKFADGLSSSMYGQMAMQIDPTGRLRALGGLSAEFRVV